MSEFEQRFYDRMRGSIHSYVERKGAALEKGAEFLLLVPDFFVLLWRLVNDPRVTGKNKVLLASGLAYFLSPIDLVPEAFLGPIGFADDLVLAVYILNKVLIDTPADVVREHWSGKGDVLATIQNVLNSADQLVGSNIINKLKSFVS